MQYRDYLQSDEWKLLKLKKSKRSKWCFICKRTPISPNYHHVRYTRELTDQTINDIRLACHDCHMIYHAVKNENPHWQEDWIMRKTKKLALAVRQS